MSSILSPSEIDFSKIAFAAPKALDSGGAVVSITYKGGPLRIQTPSMKIPYHLSTGYVPKGGVQKGDPKYSFSLSFGGAEDNKAIQEFKECIEKLDEKFVESGVENSAKWLKRPNMSTEMVKMMYTPLMKYSKEPDGTIKPYPPSLTVCLRQHKGVKGNTLNTFKSEFYDPNVRDPETGKITKFDPTTEIGSILCKEGWSTNIIEFEGLWLVSGKFNVTSKLFQARVDSISESLSGPGFKDDVPVPQQVKGSAAAAEDTETVIAPVPVPVAAVQIPVPVPVAPVFEDEAEATEAAEAIEAIEAIPVPKKIFKRKAVVAAK
jgi:hypothetical protein